MAYKTLSDTDIKRWNAEYKQLADDLPGETNPTARTLLTNQMEAIGQNVEANLDQAGRQVQAYYNQHMKKVNNWLRLSEKAIAEARKAAKAYKQDTSKGVPPQIAQAAADMALWDKAIGDDADEFGAAWFGYRGNAAGHIPNQYKDKFNVVRAKVMEDQKSVTIIRAKIRGYVAEAEGLQKVIAKATMKAGIKAGTGAQRLIADARQDAHDLATQMNAQYDLLITPRGLATQPSAISNAKDMVKNDSKNKAFTKTPGNVAMVNARKKTFESGIKLMRTQTASMEKLLSTKLKGFRKSELADDVVKAQIKKAQQSLKDAQTELKAKEAEAKKGKEYIAVIEARWKSKK